MCEGPGTFDPCADRLKRLKDCIYGIQTGGTGQI